MKAYPIQNTSEFIGKKFTILILRKVCLFEFPLVNTRAYYWLIVQIVFAIVGSFTAIQITFTAHIRGFIAGVLLIRVLIMTEQSCQVAVNEIIYLRYSVANFCP
jgi:membrane associated rhomboid family serine protease